LKGQLFRLPPAAPSSKSERTPDLHWSRIIPWQVVAPWNQLRVPLLDPCSEARGGTMTRELHVYDRASAMIALLFVSPNGTVEAFDVEGFNRIGEFASVAEAAAFACADVEMPCLDS
jgi:hypothetical protein